MSIGSDGFVLFSLCSHNLEKQRANLCQSVYTISGRTSWIDEINCIKMSHDADYLLALRLQSELDALEGNETDEIAEVSFLYGFFQINFSHRINLDFFNLNMFCFFSSCQS